MLEHYDAQFTLALARDRADRLRGEAAADRLARQARVGIEPHRSHRRARWGRLWSGHGSAGNLPPVLR